MSSRAIHLPPISETAAAPDRSSVDVSIVPGSGSQLQVLNVRDFAWTRVIMSCAAFPEALDGTRIVHLTDPHFRKRWFTAYDRLVARLRLDPPDLVLLTGDYVDDKYDARADWPLVERLVRNLHARHGIFAIHGNHDGDLLVPRLASLGARVLTHRRETVHIRGAAIELVGVCGTDRSDWDGSLRRRLPPRQRGVPRIVLSHFPDLIEAVRQLEPDLVLSGHTHGGQICLPGGRALVSHDSLPKRMASGLHRVGDTWLLVNRGTGFSSHPIRLFCPAEVVEITLTRG